MLRASITVLLLALVGGYLYDRLTKFWPVLVTNNWGSLDNFKEHEFRLQGLIRNCEDALLDEAMGLAILSCDVGRERWNTVMGVFHEGPVENGGIYIYDYSKPNLAEEEALRRVTFTDFPSAKTDFHPLGIEWEPATSTLYIANHRKTGSVIDVFQLSVASATATHVSTLNSSIIHTPNSITSIGDGKIYFTNDHTVKPAQSWLLNKIETFGGIPGGSVVYMDTKHPETAQIVARLPFPNGIVLFNSTTLAVASSYSMGVSLYTIQPDHSLAYQKFVAAAPPVDNLSVDGNGKLLMAGHTSFPSLAKVSHYRALCNSGTVKEDEKGMCDIRSGSWVAEWSEEEGLKELYIGTEFETSTTAIRDVKRNFGMVTGLYEKGILAFKT